MSCSSLNDPRTAAGSYISTLPSGTSIEYTLYPPYINGSQFSRVKSYPIYINKYIGQPPAPGNRVYNQGEAGLIARGTNYLVIDSFTYLYDNFNDPWICQHNLVECDFYNKLITNKTSYKLIATFSYNLPPYLPQLSIAFVNPVIQVYKYEK